MTDKAYEAEVADFASLMVDETIATIRVQLVAGKGLAVPDQIAVVDQLIKERKRLAATPTPPTLSEDLREAIEGVIEHVEVRIQDGKEIGSTVWRLALEDVARDLRAALAQVKAS